MTYLDSETAMLAAIIDGSDDAIISKDLNSRITSWNKSAERMFGYTADEMIGQMIHILIPEDRRSEEDQIINQLRRGERVEHFETVRVTRDGTQLDLSLTISPIVDRTGNVVGASKIARDITRQKMNERRLRLISELTQAINRKLEVNAILQLVADAGTELCRADIGVFLYNKPGIDGKQVTLRASSRSGQRVNIATDDHRHMPAYIPDFPDHALLRLDDIRMATGEKSKQADGILEAAGLSLSGTAIRSCLAAPVISQNGKVVGVLFFGHQRPEMFSEEQEAMVQSIAAQAAVGLDNAKLLDEIITLNQRKDQFIGFASHELKTPLTTLKGYTQLARAGIISPAESFDKVDRQIERIEAIIGDLMDLSMIQFGKLRLSVHRVSLASILDHSVALLDFKGRQLHYPTVDPGIIINADYQKISQVIVNLLSNAIKYTPAGRGIHLQVEQSARTVCIRVSDEGIGIESSETEKIFHQFYRVSVAAQTAPGAGLGLFITKEIVEAHAGKIWVESAPGKGATFFVELPV